MKIFLIKSYRGIYDRGRSKVKNMRMKEMSSKYFWFSRLWAKTIVKKRLYRFGIVKYRMNLNDLYYKIIRWFKNMEKDWHYLTIKINFTTKTTKFLLKQTLLCFKIYITVTILCTKHNYKFLVFRRKTRPHL